MNHQKRNCRGSGYEADNRKKSGTLRSRSPLFGVLGCVNSHNLYRGEITMDNDNKIIIDKAAFEDIVRQEVLRMRRMYFEICCEDFAPRCRVERTRRKGKWVAIIDADEWNQFDTWVSECLGDLMTARGIIDLMQPVYDEFYGEYQSKHNISFDDYMAVQLASCDADEFERVRDRFEDEYFKNLDDSEEPER